MLRTSELRCYLFLQLSWHHYPYKQDIITFHTFYILRFIAGKTILFSLSFCIYHLIIPSFSLLNIYMHSNIYKYDDITFIYLFIYLLFYLYSLFLMITSNMMVLLLYCTFLLLSVWSHCNYFTFRRSEIFHELGKEGVMRWAYSQLVKGSLF